MIEIKEILQQGVEQEHFPGAGYAIVYIDGTIVSNFVGYKQTHPTKIENTGNEIYDCASLTKVISTTTMVFKLIEEGRIGLSTKLYTVLPRFKHKEIEICHLLTHTSGLPADIPHAKTLRSREHVENKVYQFDLIHPVGKKIVYSDIGYILLGFMIEEVTGTSLSNYAKKVVFEPLRMKDTSYHPDPNRCAPTEFRNDDVHQGLLCGQVHDEKSFALGGESGHAGMFSTVQDIAKFILSFLRNDGTVLLPETVDMLFPLRAEDISERGSVLVRSYGWNKPTKGGTAGDNVSFQDTILHTGFTGCNVWIERDKGVGFVMLSNAVHPKRELNKIIRYRNTIGNIIIPKKEENNG